MSEEGQGSEYELSPPTPPENVTPAPVPGPKPGDPDWVPPTPIIEQPDPVSVDEEEPVDPDVQKNRAAAILAYIFFLIPLVMAPNSKFARYHANQGVILFIFWCVTVGVSVAMTVGWSLTSKLLWKIWPLGALFSCITHLGPAALIIAGLGLTLSGILNAANGDRKELPLLGHWNLIK